MNSRSLSIPFVTALVIAVSATACKPEASPAERGETTGVPAVAVVTQEVVASDFVERVEVAGVAEPIEEVQVAAEAPGRVTQAPFKEGEPVEKGDLLLRVDAQSDSARIDLLENQLANARREYERTKMLAREGLATPQQLDQASAQVDSASLSIKQARVGIGKSTVHSPVSGLVAEKFVEQGEYVSPGQPLAHIVDYSTIVIDAAVPEGDIGFVREGEKVDVWLPSLDRHFEGLVKRRGIVATSKTRTFPVEVHVDNASGDILPGMRARVIIPRKRWENVVVVPRDSILQGFNAKEAMVFTGDGAEGAAELRTVEVGPARGNEIVVTSGLAPGDRLIVKGHRGIVNGTRVNAVRTVSAKADDQPAAKEKDPSSELAGKPDAAPPVSN